MSTISMLVSGPSARLAMLRALALKTLGHVRSTWNTITSTLTLASATLRATANITLAMIGSRTGYELTTSLVRKATTSTWHALKWAVSGLTRLSGRATRATYTAIASLSPTVATKVEATLERWVVEPVLTTGLTIDRWVSSFGETLWQLTCTTLVRSATVTTAQAAATLIAIHTVTKGALAAKVVMALPSAMTLIVWLTNPMVAAALVAGTFTTAVVVAALMLLRAQPRPQDPQTIPMREVKEYAQVFESDDPLATVDLDAIAASLRVEVTIDGSVIVHGIPTNLPDEIAQHVAKTAADAAIRRLERILPHRKPNRDDRRVLTKVAREAVKDSRRTAA